MFVYQKNVCYLFLGSRHFFTSLERVMSKQAQMQAFKDGAGLLALIGLILVVAIMQDDVQPSKKSSSKRKRSHNYTHVNEPRKRNAHKQYREKKEHRSPRATGSWRHNNRFISYLTDPINADFESVETPREQLLTQEELSQSIDNQTQNKEIIA